MGKKKNPTVESFLNVTSTKMGIPWCINCVGFHPSDQPALEDFFQRLVDPQRAAMRKHVQTAKVIGEYVNKSCMMCGRTYDEAGEVDETWKLTAKRVKEELQNAGLFGVPDAKVEAIVAQCRKSFRTLLLNRYSIPQERWQYLTFSGQLAYILTVAQDARAKRTKVDLANAGMVKL